MQLTLLSNLRRIFVAALLLVIGLLDGGQIYAQTAQAEQATGQASAAMSAASAMPSCRVFPTASNVLALFEFNNNVNDTSGNARHASLLGGSYVPTGLGTGLQVGASAPTGVDWSAYAALLQHPYTIEMVVTPEDTSFWRKLFSFDDQDDDGWYYKDTGIQAYPHPVLGFGQAQPGERRYLTFVSTASDQINVYLDGVLLGATPASFTAPPAQAIFFRDDAATGRREQLRGVVDALRISSSARTVAEINTVQQNIQSCETAAATITIVKDAVPNSGTNFRFSGLSAFYLDDLDPQDGDNYSNSQRFSVAPGSYNVTESVPSTWVLAGITCDPSANGVVNLAQKRVTITVAAGSNVTCTFTNHYRATFNTLVYHDLNQNRVYNSGEPGLPGWTVSIYDSNNLQLLVKTTGTSGAANFTRQLAPNVTYKVCVDIATGWTRSVPTVLDPVLGKPCYTRTPTPGQTLTLRFGNKPLAVGAAAEQEVTEAVEDVTLEEAPELAPDESGYDADDVAEEEGAFTPGQSIFLPLVIHQR